MANINVNSRAQDLAKNQRYQEFLQEIINTNKGLKLNDSATKQEVDNLYTAYASGSPNVSTTTNTGTNTGAASGGGGGGGLVGAFTQGIQSMGVTQSNTLQSGEMYDISKVIGIAFDTNTGKLKSFSDIVKTIKDDIGNGILLNMKQQSQLQEKINTETGMTGKLSEDFRSSITEAYPSALRLGYSFEDISNAISNMTANIGRFRLLNEETMVDLAETSRVYFNNMDDGAAAANAFQDVSLGARDAFMMIEKTGKSSLELGLNSKATTATLVQNIGKLNQYGFKNGIEGLNQMVQKAQSLKMNLDSAFNLAEQVMDPSKALEYAANLQSLGGAYGTLADPIKMMYDATNNVEDLQDSIIGAAEGLATYNSEQGRFEVTGANLRRAREMAQYLGMDFRELTNLAVNAAQRTSAAADLMSAGLTFDNEADKEFLTNLAQMKDGKMVIEVPKNLQEKLGATEVALESMSEDQKANLLAYREEFKKMSTEDIARRQVNFVENINRDVAFLAALARIRAGKAGDTLVKEIGFDPLALAKESKDATNKVAQGIDSLSNVAIETIKGIKPDQATSKPAEQKSVPVAEAEKAKAEAEKAKTQSQSPQSKTINANINVNSSASMDGIKRDIISQPEFKDKFFAAFGEYTSPPQ